MLDVNQIAKGFFNNLLNKEEELFKERITTCRSCKLLTIDRIFGEMCNPSLYLNTVTNETSKVKKLGFNNGCGCVLRSKCRVREAQCPLSRW